MSHWCALVKQFIASHQSLQAVIALLVRTVIAYHTPAGHKGQQCSNDSNHMTYNGICGRNIVIWCTTTTVHVKHDLKGTEKMHGLHRHSHLFIGLCIRHLALKYIYKYSNLMV